MFLLEKTSSMLGRKAELLLLIPAVFLSGTVCAGEGVSFRDPQTGITVIRPDSVSVNAGTGNSGYLTGSELNRMYGKKLEKNLPYDFKFGTVDDVSVNVEGDVTAHAVMNDVYPFMPSSVKKRMENEYYGVAVSRYCRQVRAKKHNLHRIRSISVEAYTASGDFYRKVSVNPQMCQSQGTN